MVKFSIVVPLAPGRNAEVLESLKSFDKSKYEIIVEKGTNVSLNRNNGVEKSKGEIILFLDDDAFVDRELLKKGEEFLDKHKDIDIVGGPQLTPKSDRWFARISGYAIASYFGSQSMSFRYKKGKLSFDGWDKITSAVSFVRKKVFDKVKFKEGMFPGEDPEFYYNAKKNGFKISYNPDLIIYHKRRDNLKGFLKQFYLYGKMKLKTGHISLLYFVPSVFVLYLVSLAILAFIHWIFLLPLGVYLGITILFSFYEAAKNKSFFSVFLLPFFYACIHVSYGIGFLRGIIDKLIEN
jgi:succinoglycan biosynthesis protein ExoA